jgi:hypothetical protein
MLCMTREPIMRDICFTEEIRNAGPGVEMWTCNSSYLGGRGRRIMVWGRSRQKHETLLEKEK